jgi:hypothetical protein
MTLVNTREAWLLQATDLLRPLFFSKRYHISEQLAVSCGIFDVLVTVFPMIFCRHLNIFTFTLIFRKI